MKFSGEITYCNKTFLTYTGLDRSEDKNIYEIFSQISLYEIHNGYIKEIKLNGKIFRIRAIKLNHEEIYGYAVFLTDITELRKYEEQIIIANKMEAVRKLTSTYTHENKKYAYRNKRFYIVQKLRGFIFVESEPQRGTKFEIYIPSYPG